ncbi:hypothetical protein C8R46DRAFT_1067594 [Mycena filopes]|nr:hypothetical protein C8R46DRAFT_1067594 [Mycena filopes]
MLTALVLTFPSSVLAAPPTPRVFFPRLLLSIESNDIDKAIQDVRLELRSSLWNDHKAFPVFLAPRLQVYQARRTTRWVDHTTATQPGARR